MAVSEEDTPGDAFPLGVGKDMELYEQFTSVNRILQSGKDVIQLIEKFERTIDRVLHNEELSPPCLEYFLKKMLVVFTKGLLLKTDLQQDLADRIAKFFCVLLNLIVHYLEFQWQEHLEIISLLFSMHNPYFVHGQNMDEFTPVFTVDATVYADKKEKLWTVSRYLYQLINYFAELSGFEKLITGVKKPDLHLETLLAIIKPFVQLKEFFVSEWLIKYASQLWENVQYTLLDMSNEQIKTIDKRKIGDAIEWLKILLQASFPLQYLELIDNFSLSLALRYFQTPYLEKRIIGLQDIKSYILKVSDNKYANDIWVTKQFLVSWLLEHNIIEKLYVNNVHVEILSRCKEIPRFLAEGEHLTREDITTIWNAGIDKHESIVHVIYESIGLLSETLKYDMIQHVYKLLRSIPYLDYDPQIFNLIRRFSIHAINANSQTTEPQFYGLEISWDLVQDDVAISDDIKNLANVFIKDFLNWKECYSQRRVIMEKCLENLRIHNSVIPSLQILKTTIETYSVPIDGECISTIIVDLEENGNLLQLVFDDLVHYKRSTITSSSDDQREMLRSHIYQIKERLAFFEFITCSSTVNLSKLQIDMFWEYVIQNALTDDEQRIGYDWLKQIGDITKTFQPFSSEMYLYIFSEKFSTLDMKTASPNCVNLIIAYFEYINTLNGGLRYEQRKFVPISFDLYGFDLLWRIVFECPTDSSANKAINYSINILKTPTPALISKVSEQGEQYIQKCFSEIQLALDTNTSGGDTYTLRVLRAITVLQVMSIKFSGSQPVHGSIGSGKPMVLTLSGFAANNETFTLSMSSNDKVADLRANIAQQVKVDVSRVRIITAGRECKDTDGTLQDASIKEGQKITYIFRPPGAKPISTSSSNFSTVSLLSKPEYFTKLFELLSCDDIIASEVWELLMTLPTNEIILQRISEGRGEQQIQWEDILDSSCVYRLLYMLQIIDSLTQNSRSKEDSKTWCDWFLKTGGITHLLKLLRSDIWSVEILTEKHISCLAMIFKFLSEFCVKDIDGTPTADVEIFFEESTQTPQILVECLLGIMYSATTTVGITSETLAIIVLNGFRMLVAICSSVVDCTSVFLSYPALENWIASVLLFSTEPTREAALTGLFQLFWALNDLELKYSLFDKLLGIMPLTNGICETAEQFYLLLEMLSRRFCVQYPNEAASNRFSDFFGALFTSLKNRDIIEVNNSIQDPVLSGILTLMTTLFSFRPDLKARAGLQVATEVFTTCLFDIPDSTTDSSKPPPKCKNKLSRQVAYGLLIELVQNNNIIWDILEAQLTEHHAVTSMPTSWNYSPQALVKSPCGYVGLQNLGSTCYMNSLMQQLFMVPSFRFGILSIPDGESTQQPLLHQLKRMFGSLQESAKKYFETNKFCETYGGEEFSPLIQQDADEYFNVLFDKLETATKGTKHETLLRDVFGGSVCNQVISKECEHVSENKENFYTLSVAVKGKSSLEESLDLFIEGDMLEGDNKYHCGKCDKKVSALKRCCVESLPNTLIVHMRRFEFDLEEMRRMKVNDYCKFPFEFSLEPYTKEGLARREAISENREPPTKLRDDSYYEFELSGILVHSGTAETGHYYSFIREFNSQEWLQFNDTFVDSFDRGDIPRQCYGGVEAAKGFDTGSTLPRINNAYMLFYQRKKPIKTNTEKSLREIARTTTQFIEKDIFEQLWQDNRQFLRDTYIYDTDYFSFVYNYLLSQDNTSITVEYDQPMDVNCLLFRCIQLGCQVVAQTLCHAKERGGITGFMSLLKSQFSRHLPGCVWFLKSMVSNNWLEPLILRCTSEITRKAVADLLLHVITCVSPYEDTFYCLPKRTIDNTPLEIADIEDESPDPMAVSDDNLLFQKQSAIGEFLDSYFRLIPNLPSFWRTFSQYFELLKSFASLGLPEKQFLLDCSLCASLIDCIMREETHKTAEDTDWPVLPSKFLSKVNITPLLELLCEIVSSCETSVIQDEPSDLLKLGRNDLRRLYWPDFYLRVLKMHCDVTTLAALLVQVLWEDQTFSQQMMDAILPKLYFLPRDGVDRYCTILREILVIEDSLQEWRINYAIPEMLEIIDQYDEKQPLTTPTLIRYLIDWASQSLEINSIIYDHTNSWLFSWLVFSDLDLTREACEALVRTLLNQGKQLDASHSEEVIALRATIILTMLVEFIPSTKEHTFKTVRKFTVEGNQNDYQSSPWKLGCFFRLMTFLTKSPEDILTVLTHGNEMLDLIHNGIDSKYYELDGNKLEFLNFWHHLTKINNSLALFLTSVPKRDIFELINFYVCLRTGEEYKEYNRKTMSMFYEVMHCCCKESQEFLRILLDHNHFLWAVESLYLSPLYSPVDDKIFSILCLGSTAFGEKFRVPYICRTIQWSTTSVQFSYKNALALFDQFLQGEKELHEFCEANGPDYVSIYPNMSEQSSVNLLHRPDAAVGIQYGLSVLVKATTFLLDNESGNKDNLISNWESKINLLPPIRNYLHCDNERILQLSYTLLYNLARLDNLFFENLIQCLCQEHENLNSRPVSKSKKLYTLEKPSTEVSYFNHGHGAKHERYYNFLSATCHSALETMFLDAQLIRNVLQLLIFGALETLRSQTVSTLFINLLQKVWDYQYYKELLRDTKLLDTLIITAMTKYHMSDELFAFVKSVLPEVQSRLPEEAKTEVPAHAMKILEVCLLACTEDNPLPSLENGIVDFVKICILVAQDPTMKAELATKRMDIKILCEYVKTQPPLFEKISRGIDQITLDYLLDDTEEGSPNDDMEDTQEDSETQPQ